MPEHASVQITPITDRVVLRLKSWQPEDQKALRREIGFGLPSGVRALCLSPGDWLIVTRSSGGEQLRSQLAPEAARLSSGLLDVTDAMAGFEVSGPSARELLSKVCGLDLHSHAFPIGHFARTRLAQIPVVIECVGEANRFELLVTRSYLRYLDGWLHDAALSVGEPLQ